MVMIEKLALDPIVEEVEEFLLDTGMSATAFGWLAKKDPSLVRQLRHGRELRIQTREGIRAYMAEYRRDHPK